MINQLSISTDDESRRIVPSYHNPYPPELSHTREKRGMIECKCLHVLAAYKGNLRINPLTARPPYGESLGGCARCMSALIGIFCRAACKPLKASQKW